jgi:RNA polymerase sigma factor (sigma-70 family)
MSTAVQNADAELESPVAPAPTPLVPAGVPRLSGALLRTQSDARLTRLAAGGYEGAFEELVRRYRGPLHAYCRRFLHPTAAEDVVQQAFSDLWARLAAGQQIREVRPWLYRVVHNAALNVIRRSDYRCEQLPEIVGSDSPDVAYERKATLRAALAGVAALPDKQRQAVIHAVDGHSRAQIAAAMGVSDGAVGQMLHRARASLRAAIAAIVPWPLVAWAAAGRRYVGSAVARALSTAGAGGGPAEILVKGGATLAVIAAATATPLVVKQATTTHAPSPAAAALAASSAPESGAPGTPTTGLVSTLPGALPAQQPTPDRGTTARAAGSPPATAASETSPPEGAPTAPDGSEAAPPSPEAPADAPATPPPSPEAAEPVATAAEWPPTSEAPPAEAPAEAPPPEAPAEPQPAEAPAAAPAEPAPAP